MPGRNYIEFMIVTRHLNSGVSPVSYTHLDVYKRQTYRYHIINLNISKFIMQNPPIRKTVLRTYLYLHRYLYAYILKGILTPSAMK